MFELTDAAEDVADEALIKAIKRMNDPEEEGKRHDSCSDDESDSGKPLKMPTGRVDKDMERMQNDTALRHHLKLGSSFTGPKGVKADYKFHMDQERARRSERSMAETQRISDAALSSGWMQRTIAAEERTLGGEEEDDFLKTYREKRIAELQRMSKYAAFGSVLELQQDSFVRNIDGERPDVKVLIHLYDNANQASRLVNDFFTRLAPMYSSTKFCRIVSRKADPDFDHVGLPAILVYKGGALEISLIRIIDEIPGWFQTGICSMRDFEEYLVLQGVLQDQNRADTPPPQEDSETEDDLSD